MELRSLIWKLLIEQLDQNTINLKNKYVGEGKPVSEKDFEKIVEVTKNKFYLLSWITKKVGGGIIKNEDIYKYEEYFDIFEKNKNRGKFKNKDIHLYKTPDDVLDFIEEAIKVKEGDIKFEETVGKDNYVTPNNIQKLEASGGIKYLGIFDGYQVFQVSKVGKDVWKLYRDILGRCQGQGSKIRLCTIADYDYFKTYLKEPQGSSYFILFNLDDPKSPYQLHFESGQFMDKNDSKKIKIQKFRFYEWISARVPRYNLEQDIFPGILDLPVKGKGLYDDDGLKQGLFKTFDRYRDKPYLQSIANYKNDRVDGSFVFYHPNGQVFEKGNLTGVKANRYGDYESFDEKGKLHYKGSYDKSGRKIGLWTYSSYRGSQRLIDYDTNPVQITGLTKSGLVRFISQIRLAEPKDPYGETLFFNRSGNVAAKGRLGVGLRQLGDWQYFFPDGSVRAEGKFVGNCRKGEWTDVLKTDQGKMIFVANFSSCGPPDGKVKVYDSKGVFVKKVSGKKIEPSYWDDSIYDPSIFAFS